MEHGDTHARTKQSIAKLMSDAEKQYVAEYAQKASPGSAVQHKLIAMGVPAYADDGIRVQQLNEGSGGNSVGEHRKALAAVHCNSWELASCKSIVLLRSSNRGPASKCSLTVCKSYATNSRGK